MFVQWSLMKLNLTGTKSTINKVKYQLDLYIWEIIHYNESDNQSDKISKLGHSLSKLITNWVGIYDTHSLNYTVKNDTEISTVQLYISGLSGLINWYNFVQSTGHWT